MNDATSAEAPTLRERIAAWWAEKDREPLGLLTLAAVLCVATITATRCRTDLEQAQQATAVQTNPLAPLVARLDALDAEVVDLQGRVADLEDQRPAASPRPRMSRPPAGVAPEPVAEPTAWSAPTDLDRAISAFNATLQEPTK